MTEAMLLHSSLDCAVVQFIAMAFGCLRQSEWQFCRRKKDGSCIQDSKWTTKIDTLMAMSMLLKLWSLAFTIVLWVGHQTHFLLCTDSIQMNGGHCRVVIWNSPVALRRHYT